MSNQQSEQLQINDIKPETPLVDCLDGCARKEIRVHDHGMLALVDVMPRLVPQGQTADHAIVQAARVSYGQGTRKVSEDRGLIRYLLRHHHTTPFEMIECKFHCVMPIFVARQWIRHRTANVNEYSARYSIVPDRFYQPTPEAIRQQSLTNKQGGEEPVTDATAQDFLQYLAQAEKSYSDYLKFTDLGVARELARIALPQSAYTEWYWKCDLHNTLRFLALRIDAHAQAEIRAFARAMLALLEPIVPLTIEAWKDYSLGSMHLTRLEVEAIKQGKSDIDTANKREQREWQEKRARLGLGDNIVVRPTSQPTLSSS
jgi:thymidylate synthase (FAD)